MQDKLILVTNDDGITAPGLKHLIEVGQTMGRVVVVAPDSPRSGQGHAITINDPIRIKKVDIFEDIEAYECTGTPVDCVKLAKNVLFKEETIDLCISGINHGSNAGINVIYSGTMSAAMEASLEGIDSIGFSLDAYDWSADFSHALPMVSQIIASVLAHGLKGCKLLNVNLPAAHAAPIKGIRICSQGQATWKEDFLENTDPRGSKYYWLSGQFVDLDHRASSDIKAVKDGYISVVPTGHDLTVYTAQSDMRYLEEIS